MTSHHRRDDQRAGRRQDLRNRELKFTGAGLPAPWPKVRRTLKLSTMLKVLAVLLLLAALYETSLSRTHPECRGDQAPRYCMD